MPRFIKCYFDGHDFDTANIIQLTDTAANFYPSWTANSDTIYYDSNLGTPKGTNYFAIWKMSANVSGKKRVSPSDTYGRQPIVASNNLIYYFYYAERQPEIFSMNKDGSNIRQITFNGQFGNRKSPKYWKGNLFYYDNGTLKRVDKNNQETKLTSPCITYDISMNGEIVYSKMYYDILRKETQNGTLWIMNPDGSNNRQLTFNN